MHWACLCFLIRASVMNSLVFCVCVGWALRLRCEFLLLSLVLLLCSACCFYGNWLLPLLLPSLIALLFLMCLLCLCRLSVSSLRGTSLFVFVFVPAPVPVFSVCVSFSFCFCFYCVFFLFFFRLLLCLCYVRVMMCPRIRIHTKWQSAARGLPRTVVLKIPVVVNSKTCVFVQVFTVPHQCPINAPSVPHQCPNTMPHQVFLYKSYTR